MKLLGIQWFKMSNVSRRADASSNLPKRHADKMWLENSDLWKAAEEDEIMEVSQCWELQPLEDIPTNANILGNSLLPIYCQ